MLNVKHLTLFKPKNWKKAGFFTKVARKIDSKRWWCLLSKNYSILNLGEFFHIEKYRVFTQFAAATILRHWATMS